jgi:hypothetical protein
MYFFYEKNICDLIEIINLGGCSQVVKAMGCEPVIAGSIPVFRLNFLFLFINYFLNIVF